jgi:hypothetical protein
MEITPQALSLDSCRSELRKQITAGAAMKAHDIVEGEVKKTKEP